MSTNKEPSAAEMIAAIEQAQGFVMKAVEILGISRTSFYTYLKRKKSVQQALDDQREKRHQWVESKLMKAVGEDNLTAIIFYLKTQGKHLGYIERQEIALKDIDEAIENELARVAGRSED